MMSSPIYEVSFNSTPPYEYKHDATIRPSITMLRWKHNEKN